MVNTLADYRFGFDQLEYITERLQENLNIDRANIFYQLCWFDEFNYWKKYEQGCCICMFLVYADKEDDIEPVIIEDDIPMKTTNLTQKAANTIQDYLRRQQYNKKS